jgi:acyl-CoA reductase-like NAD-dependent aldehyde dehydrogenase
LEETLKRVVAAAGGRRTAIVVADFDRDGRPRPPKAEERAAWEAFFDGQKGLDVELSLYEEDRTWAPG